MSVGLGLLQKIVADGRPLTVLSDAGLTVDAFDGNEKAVYDFLHDYVRRHGALPKITTVEHECELKFADFPDEPIGYWLENVKNRASEEMILAGFKEAKALLTQGDFNSARDEIRNIALSLDTIAPTDEILTLDRVAQQVLDAHDHRQRTAGWGGVPFGVQYLDDVSDGAQAADTIAFAGRPGVGKSFLLFMMALFGYLQADSIPLVVNMEMSAVQCARRLLALFSGITATNIKLGSMSHWARQRIVSDLRELQRIGQRPFYILQGSLNSTVEDLALRIQELRPNIVYIDGAYLMRTKANPRSRWERVTEVAEYQKTIAREFNIPVVATWQFNRKGSGSLGNIAYSDAIVQLASIVAAIENEKSTGNRWQPVSRKKLSLLKGREGEAGTVLMTYDMSRMIITQHSVLEGYRNDADVSDGDERE